MAQAVTGSDFDAKVLKTDDVVLIDFWAPWCGPCQMLGPVLEELSSEMDEGAQIYKVNVDEEPELASQYGVMSIPAIKVFKGGEVVEETVGVQPKENLKAMIDKHR